jgi:hypothetical protein
MNKLKKRKVIEEINETKSWFFKKIDTIGSSLLKLTKKKKIHNY